MIGLIPSRLREIAILGAHCDDIPIGMGATLLKVSRSNPGLRVRALVLSGGGTEREVEERAALAAFCPGADLEVTVADIPDGRSPAHWNAVKEHIGRFRRGTDADVVFATQRGDAHQDHRTVAELVPTEFRDHLILGYEILKWETDTPRPTFCHPISADLAAEKARLLRECYPSQVAHDWFTDDAFGGLSRIRGVQCHSEHAEAFIVDKAIVNFGGEDA